MEHRRVFDRPTPNAFDCEVSDMFHETAVPARPLISVPRPRRRKEVRDPYDGLRPWSAITHGIGAALAVAGTVFLAVQSAWIGKWENLVLFLIYGVSMVCLYTASTLYHCVNTTRSKRIALRKYDHCSIYLLIAGSYTPVALSVIGGWQGTVIAIIQWAMVLFGIFYKSLSKRSIPAISLTIYLIMGWTIIFFFPLFLRNSSLPLLILIAAGGIFYTIGAWFYAKKGFKYHHLVWHLMINIAASCHFVAIVFFLNM